MIHIGSSIKEVFEGKGMTISEFGRRINKSRENIYSIFRRKTIDTGLLIDISGALDHDFFQYYTPLLNENIELKAELSLFKKATLILNQSEKFA